MGFIESFFKKEADKIEYSDIESFVSQRIEESLNLDYKNIADYNKPNELAKDISAFANSAGGLVILGVEEDASDPTRIYPKAITWGDSSLSKETLENHLISKISYRIDGLRIVPVRKPDKSVIFLIDVPQSENPPHMSWDKRYYKRLNFQSVPMEHYEVADFFGRRRKPRLSLVAEIIDIEDPNAQSVQFKIRIYLINKGKSAAKYTMVVISFNGATAIGETPNTNLQRIDSLREEYLLYNLTKM